VIELEIVSLKFQFFTGLTFQMNSQESFPNNVDQKILLMGDIENVFLDGSVVSDSFIEYRRDLSEGIEAAAKNKFKAFAVIIGRSAQIDLVLLKLRNVNPKAKIILLAQMYQEPEAVRLVGLSTNGFPLADDYLICPLRLEDLYNSVLNSLKVPTVSSAFVDYDAQRERKIHRLEKLATTDDLTGLKNRRYVREFCTQIIDYAKKRSGRVTLFMFDIDYFKSYNDIYSHSAGDEVLRQVAVLMRRCCRPHDVVGRIGGDEFVFIFWDDPKKTSSSINQERRSSQADHPREAISIARRFQRELKKAQLTLLGPQGKGLLTISGGLVSFPRDGSSAQELFDRADKALLEAKRSGKNRVYLVGNPQSDIADIK
jgi:diguanylate cyclase (GGDEF)-like protein